MPISEKKKINKPTIFTWNEIEVDVHEIAFLRLNFLWMFSHVKKLYDDKENFSH